MHDSYLILHCYVILGSKQNTSTMPISCAEITSYKHKFHGVPVSLCSFLAVSYNLPKFRCNSSWNIHAITLENSDPIPYSYSNIFLSKTNTFYAVFDGVGPIFTGTSGNMIQMSIADGGYSVFVADNDNVYAFDNNMSQVSRWSMGTTSSQPVMFIGRPCQDLFVDTNSTLFCCLDRMDQVVSKSLHDPTNTLTMVAGTGCSGSASHMLADPSGIFVDLSFNLYVADSGNDRIQCFTSGQMNATTLAGHGAPGTISLKHPVDIVLDGDGFVFIVDQNNHRIVGSGPDGFRCVAGCGNGSGSASNQLSTPQSMSFDSYGNIWVADTDNGRIQMFVLDAICHGKCHYYMTTQIRYMIDRPLRVSLQRLSLETGFRRVVEYLGGYFPRGKYETGLASFSHSIELRTVLSRFLSASILETKRFLSNLKHD